MRSIVQALHRSGPGANGDTLRPVETENRFLWSVWQGTALAVRQDEAGGDMRSKKDWV